MGEERGYCHNKLRAGHSKLYDMVEIRKEKERGWEESSEHEWMHVSTDFIRDARDKELLKISMLWHRIVTIESDCVLENEARSRYLVQLRIRLWKTLDVVEDAMYGLCDC